MYTIQCTEDLSDNKVTITKEFISVSNLLKNVYEDNDEDDEEENILPLQISVKNLNKIIELTKTKVFTNIPQDDLYSLCNSANFLDIKEVLNGILHQIKLRKVRNLVITTDVIDKYPKIDIFGDVTSYCNITEEFLTRCKKFSDAGDEPELFSNLSLNPTLSLELVDKFDYKWDYSKLSLNPNLTLDYVLKHINENWKWDYVCVNTSISLEEILNTPIFKKKFLFLNRKDMTFEFLEKIIENFNTNVDGYFANYSSLICDNASYYSSHRYVTTVANSTSIYTPKLTNDLLKKYPIETWDLTIKNNPKSIRLWMQDNRKNIQSALNSVFAVRERLLSAVIPHLLNEYTDTSFIEKYIQYIPADCFGSISSNKFLTKEFIKKNIHKLDIVKLIEAGTITHSDYPVVFNNFMNRAITDRKDKHNFAIYKSKCITVDIIDEYKLYNLYLSSNPNINMTFVKNHPEIKWNMSYLSGNPGITMTDIENNKEYAWNVDCIIKYNPNVTFEFFKRLTLKNVEMWLIKGYLEILSNRGLLTLEYIEEYENIFEFCHFKERAFRIENKRLIVQKLLSKGLIKELADLIVSDKFDNDINDNDDRNNLD